MREKILFDDGWLFHLGEVERRTPSNKGALYTGAKTSRARWGAASENYNDAPDGYWIAHEQLAEKWVTVDLPHDYMIEKTPSEENNNALGFVEYENAWYRKHISFGAEDMDKRISFIFDGVATNATVYFNGVLVAHNYCGYTSFEVDVTDFIRFGQDNVLAVYVDAVSQDGWWYGGGGIYRHVWLQKTDCVSVDLYGVYLKPRRESADDWRVDVETTVRNDGDEDADIRVVTTFFAPDGGVAATAETTALSAARDIITLKYGTAVSAPLLWDVDSPRLYTAETVIYKNGEPCDSVRDRFGFREFHFDPDNGLILNGRHVVIKGVCAHLDFGLTGKAVPDNIQRYKIELIKQMGANGYRTAHYPHSDATMDALDEMGFIVMDETRRFESTEEGKKQLEMLIKRDRNRPSVFMWSIGNEEPWHGKEMGVRITRNLKAFVKRLDDTRPVTTAISDGPLDSPVAKYLDIIGVNYNLESLDAIHKKHPALPIAVSECCATSSTRGWYFDACAERGYLPAYDMKTNDWWWSRERTQKYLAERPFVAGWYQWDAFEHRGEAVWPRVCSQAGAIDLFLQKKDAFYQNLSHWSDEPMVHLLPHWNHDVRIGEILPVWAYTNCEELELIVNGESLGRQPIERYGHGEWQVAYQPGEIRVRAYNGGKPVAEDVRKTTGRPIALKLICDTPELAANGRDTALFTCTCVDADGNTVPDAAPFVSFHANALGKVIGTGSDISDHRPVPCTDRKMRAGSISVAVKVGKTGGVLRLYAESEGLTGAYIEVPLGE